VIKQGWPPDFFDYFKICVAEIFQPFLLIFVSLGAFKCLQNENLTNDKRSACLKNKLKGRSLAMPVIELNVDEIILL